MADTLEQPKIDDAEVRVLAAELRTLETEILMARQLFARQTGVTFGGARDEYEVLGYDRTITTRQYREEYERGGIAGRIIDVMPDATWRGDPAFELIEDENPKRDTLFEKAWKDIELQHGVISKLQRVDRLSRLSTYAVLLIGAPGELNTELPQGSPDKLLYFMPFSGGGGPVNSSKARTNISDSGADCTVAEYVTDSKSPRFGLPLSYQLKRTDYTSADFMRPVHWSRIIHVAEGLLDDEVFGQPALERIWNLLADLRKVTGGGAEAFWLRANQGMHLDIDKDMALPDVQNTIDNLKKQVDNYRHGITRWLRTRGVNVDTLGSDVANFSSPADAVLTQIAGSKGIPKRILTGSEMGELASSQDRENFKDIINGRQLQHAGPNLVRQLADRLITYSYLPAPAKGPLAYRVRWSHTQVLTETEQVEGAKGWATVNATSGSTVFTNEEIREKWANKEPLTEDQKAQAIADKQAEQPEPPEALDAPPFGQLKAAGGVGSGIPGHITNKKEYGEAEKVLDTILGGPKASRATRKKANVDTIKRVKTEDLHKLVGAYEIIERASKQKSFALDRVRAEIKLRGASLYELGDSPGHEFHGNQWTSSLSGLSALHDKIKDHSARLPNPTAGSTAHYRKQIERLSDGVRKHLETHPLDDAYENRRLQKALDAADKLLNSKDPDSIDLDQALSHTHNVLIEIGYKKPTRYLAEDEIITVLAEAIKAGNQGVIDKIIGLNDVPHKYGTTQIQLPPTLAERLTALGNTIKDEDLYEPEGGRETDAHITVRYGLLEPDPEDLRAVVANHGSVSVRLGQTGMFSAPEYDVVYVAASSAELGGLHTAIGMGLPVAPSSHPTYTMHATVAYVKPGRGAAYAGLDNLSGETFIADSLTLIDSEKNRHEVSLA